MERWYPQYKSQKHLRKEKKKPRKHNHIYNYNYNYDYDRDSRFRERDRSYSRDKSQDYYRDDYRKENYWDNQNWKHRSRHRNYYGDMCGDRYIDNCRNTYKEHSYRDKYRYDSFDSDRGRSKEKHCLHNARKDNGFVSNNPRIEWLHKVLKQLSPDKVVAIQFVIASSINFDNMFDSIHSP